ncbi:hypothetical protein B0H10DRAFT_1946230 [Mycena sp. CBHHK59/15]|nr:hypothetical protein B0H10DRAFT_1946230 [Mycena sp. CBHHK59/15]
MTTPVELEDDDMRMFAAVHVPESIPKHRAASIIVEIKQSCMGYKPVKLSGVGPLRRWEITWGDLREWPGPDAKVRGGAAERRGRMGLRLRLRELEKSSKMLRVVLDVGRGNSKNRIKILMAALGAAGKPTAHRRRSRELEKSNQNFEGGVGRGRCRKPTVHRCRSWELEKSNRKFDSGAQRACLADPDNSHGTGGVWRGTPQIPETKV